MDCPGIMVGPDAERTALVRHSVRMFNTGANLTTPLFGVVVRKAYGLGVQAMCGASDAAIRRTALYGTGWQGAFETPDEIGPVIARIKTAVAAAGRHIADDHYGAAFAYRYGSWDDEPVVRSARAYRERLERDPTCSMVIGGSGDIIQRIEAYVGAGVSKFVLRPIGGDDDDIMEQTQYLIDEVLPAVAALNKKAA